MKRLIAALIASAILITALVAPASASQTRPSEDRPEALNSYTYGCGVDPDYNFPISFPNYKMIRMTVRTDKDIRGAQGSAWNLNNLFLCAGDTWQNPLGDWGATFVLPANLQQGTTSTGSGGTGIVQLGYGEDNGYWNNVFGVQGGYAYPKFVWTPSDSSGGAAAGVTWAETPEYGNTYTFEIDMSVCPVSYGWGSDKPCWKFKITDVTDSQSWEKHIKRNWNNSTWGTPLLGSSYGDVAWWGYEDDNSGSVLGRLDTSTTNAIGGNYWKDKDTGGWVAGSTVEKKIINDVLVGQSDPPSWYWYEANPIPSTIWAAETSSH